MRLGIRLFEPHTYATNTEGEGRVIAISRRANVNTHPAKGTLSTTVTDEDNKGHVRFWRT